MTIPELIKKYHIEDGAKYGRPGALYIPRLKKLTQKELAEIKSFDKELILTELALQEERARRAQEEEAEKRQKLIDGIWTGDVKLEAIFVDGDYPHWEVSPSEAGPILAKFGAAREVNYGYWLSPEIVKLGAGWTVQDAQKIMRPVLEAEADRKIKEVEAREVAFAEAKRTGKPIEIRRYTEPCNGSVEECSLNIIIDYALPDGSTKRERVHTF